MDEFRVQVPNGVQPGSRFKCRVNGREQFVICPPGARPGQTVSFRIPRVPPRVKAPAPPPPPPLTASNPVTAYSNGSSTGQTHYGQPVYAGTAPPPASYNPTSSVSPESVFEMIDFERKGRINAHQLMQGLEYAGYLNFNLRVCNLMVSMFDTDLSSTMSQAEFISLFGYLSQWQKLFEKYDTDKNGSISLPELKVAIQGFGYKFSEPFYALLFHKYDADRSGTISFDEFIQIFCELHILTEAFKRQDTTRTGVATFPYEEFLRACFSIHS